MYRSTNFTYNVLSVSEFCEQDFLYRKLHVVSSVSSEATHKGAFWMRLSVSSTSLRIKYFLNVLVPSYIKRPLHHIFIFVHLNTMDSEFLYVQLIKFSLTLHDLSKLLLLFPLLFSSRG